MKLRHKHVMEEPLLSPAPLKSWKSRLAAFFSKRMFGLVISPISILYTRNPALLFFSLKLESTFNGKLKISEREKLFIRLLVSMQNGCSFCGDMALAHAFQKKVGRDSFVALVNGDYECHEFNDAEKALIGFVNQRMQGFVNRDRVQELRTYYSERQIVDIGWAIAAECYYNTLALTFSIESNGLVAAPDSEDDAGFQGRTRSGKETAALKPHSAVEKLPSLASDGNG
ncbi:MAG: hypothetical protein CMN76_06400 [Spirochaetaceae bacterium]|nr:hypothetical protein [Spirochaetaceae bacterium]